MRTPLQIVVLRDSSNRSTDVYADTLRLAFEGSAGADRSPSAYLDDAVDLGIRVLEPLEGIGEQEVERLVKGARHTILVVIGKLSDRTALFEKAIITDNIICVEAPLELDRGEVQDDKASDEVETALAPVVTALRTMQCARRVLVHSIDNSTAAENSLKLFISHAKIDGVAIAKSLIGILRQLQEISPGKIGFSYFYDYDHLAPGMVWREVLISEAKQSVLIALRTEAYESRYWCRREFLLAERNAMPILVVDLRKEQYHDSSLLPFDSAPTVRVHDGNLIRVILHAMAAHLRVLRVRSEAPSKVKVLPHRPSMYSLGPVCQAVNSGQISKVAYPGPKLPMETILIQGRQPVELVTFDELEDC